MYFSIQCEGLFIRANSCENPTRKQDLGKEVCLVKEVNKVSCIMFVISCSICVQSFMDIGPYLSLLGVFKFFHFVPVPTSPSFFNCF